MALHRYEQEASRLAHGELDELEPAALMTAARQEAGLDDYGDMAFVEPLTRLIRALVAEAGLSQAGVMGTRGRMVQCLVNRLRMQDDLKKHPEMLEEEVRAPIVILGLARTGTSKLQRMMSSDPGLQRLLLWKLINPAPLPGWKRGEPDGRIEFAKGYEQQLAQQPDVLPAHPMAAGDTDEDVFMMDMTFEGLLLMLQYRIPSFYDWVRPRPMQPFYEYEKRLLQFLQWQDEGGRGRPWVLKSQTHLRGLQALVDTFPDATIVHAHRDVGTAMASTMRAGESYRRLMAEDIDLADHGADFLNLFSTEMSMYLDMRTRLESSFPIIDISYKDIVEAPADVIRRIYAAHGRTLTPRGRTRNATLGRREPAVSPWQDRVFARALQPHPIDRREQVRRVPRKVCRMAVSEPQSHRPARSDDSRARQIRAGNRGSECGSQMSRSMVPNDECAPITEDLSADILGGRSTDAGLGIAQAVDAERLGFRRVWISERYNLKGLASWSGASQPGRHASKSRAAR